MNTPATDHAARLAAGQACLEAALKVYLPLGLSVVCECDPAHIGASPKHVEECDSPGKRPIHLWKDLQSRPSTPEEIQGWWHDFPIGNVGCVLGQVSKLVRVDVDGPEGETLLTTWSAGDLPATWTFRSSPAGRGLLYAWPENVPCKTTSHQAKGDHKELRLMANGSQTVLPPSRHPSGAMYTWEPGHSPFDMVPTPAPVWLVERLRKKAPQGTRDQARTSLEALTHSQIASMLYVIPNADAPYDEWLNIGMALHSSGDPAARQLWDDWSQQSGKYDEGKQAKAWESFHADGAVTIGTLVHLAKANGWRKARASLTVTRKVPDMTGNGTPATEDAQQRQNGYTPGAAPTIDPDALYTDSFNARALVQDHGKNLRYCYPWKSWLVWTGTYWQRDTSGTVMQLAKQTVKRLARQAEYLPESEAKALLGHVKASLATSKLKAMIENAQSEPGIPVQPEALDADPWLLNVQNGTIDLKTGSLREHQQTDLSTRCIPIQYDATAQCPTWKRFLWRAMGGTRQDAEEEVDLGSGELENRRIADERATALIDFLRRAVGYSLTGSTREQCIFILHGPTKTGKSTFLAALRALLGPYGQQADMSSFMHKERDEVRNDLADLAGSRFVCAIESQKDRRLAESLIKQLTGGVDLIKARFLFQEYFTYKPQFKIFLGTNHKPVIKDTDDAIWERIRPVPFTVQIPKHERDKTLDEQLQHELPGILTWAMQGCLEWQRLGELREPQAVEELTKKYRDEMDDIGRFLKEACFLDKDYKTKASLLLKAYHQWTGQTEETAKGFAAKLADRGYENRHSKTGNFWHGIGLPADHTEGGRG